MSLVGPRFDASSSQRLVDGNKDDVLDVSSHARGTLAREIEQISTSVNEGLVEGVGYG